MSASEVVVVLVTAPNEEAAERIARALVDERLAACVNLVGPIRSIYRWEGAVHEDAERLLVAKTRRSLLGHVAARVRELHDYDVPEVLALPVAGGSEAYLAWLLAATDGSAGE
jgi:periplasmic divalent cation tolerance protein